MLNNGRGDTGGRGCFGTVLGGGGVYLIPHYGEGYVGMVVARPDLGTMLDWHLLRSSPFNHAS
jgi:hypothetical protein